MRCPYCSYSESKVIDSRPAEEGTTIRRRRECLSCGKRFTTYEIMERLPLLVIKRDGSRQSFPFCPAVRFSAEPHRVKICLCQRRKAVDGIVFAVEGGSSSAKRSQQQLRRHALHPQFSLFGRLGLSFFLAGDVRDIGVLHMFPRQDAPQMVPDEEARAVAVRQDDEPPGLPIETQQFLQLPVLEDAEAPGLQDHPVHDLQQAVFVIAPLHHQGFTQLRLHVSAAMVTNRLRSRSSGSAWLLFMRRSVSAHRRIMRRYQDSRKEAQMRRF